MKKTLALFLLIFLIGCTKVINKNYSKISIYNGKNLIDLNVEIADDNQKRTNGLMFRGSLDETSGMFFIFENENYQIFWMKNTLIPLDLVYIDKNLKVVDIKYAVPCKEDPCAVYKSAKPAKYVLEVNGNFTAKKNIKPGDKIVLNQ